ncbi:3'-5' exoribonuclease YhaM family protein [Clostridium cylindrosporum]|nr:HD domain-containing protein [Clostridium cylindrosporum]
MLDLNLNTKIDNLVFIVRQISKKIGQNSKEYYTLQISRGIKTYDAKIWSGDEKYECIIPGDIVKITGMAKDFKGLIQIHINEISVLEEVDASLRNELLPFCSKSESILRKEIEDIISTIEDKYILELINKVFDVPEVKESFYKKSAGVEIHHAYVRGLAEHSLEVAKNTISFCKMGYSIKYDIAVTAALLHDVGKVYELSDFPENKYTEVGRMLGHITIGSNLIQKCINEIKDFPREIELDIIHAILSHHGNKDMGSPVVPMTLEAIAVHNADKASAEINAFYLSVQRDNSSSNWTEYNNIYKRCIKKS